MRRSTCRGAMAARLRMPTLQPQIGVRVPASGAALLAVQGLPPPSQSARRHDDGELQVAADHLVSCDLPHDAVQDQHRRAGHDAPAWHHLEGGLADWLNVLLGKLNTALSGTHHAFKFTKYAQRYLADAQYRFNRRFDLAAMVPRLAVAVMRASSCSKRKILKPADART